MKRLLIVPVILTLGLVGCSPPEIVPVSGNVYLITARTPGEGMGTKAEIFRMANEFADKKGKVAVPVTYNEWHPNIGTGGRFEYQFKLVDKDSPEAQNTTMEPRPNTQKIIIEKTDKSTSNITTKDTTEKKPDMYAELLKLDDLRKKGIITEAEFEAQKKKLLEGK